MDSLEKELKKNGMLLKEIPKRERTEEQCKIAVHQNPQAIRFVPWKLQTVSLCKYALKKDPSVFKKISSRVMSEKLRLFAVKQDFSLLGSMDERDKTEKVCRAALEESIEALQYMPDVMKNSLYDEPSEELASSCLAWIQRDIEASCHLPICIKTDHSILRYQKEHKCLDTGLRFNDPDTQMFCVQLKFTGHQPYTVTAQFPEFDEYYDFLDCNLSGALLQDCKFEGIDLHQYKIDGAVINSEVLKKQGLYDATYYNEKILNAAIPKSAAERNELSLPDGFRYLRPVEDDGHQQFDADKIVVFYVSDIHLWHRVRNRFKECATKEEIYAFIREIAKKLVSSVGTIPNNSFLLIAGDTSSMFEFSYVFYTELAKLWRPDRIVVISGNHELWDPVDSMENNILFYRKFFEGLGIIYLQNELLCINEDFFMPYCGGNRLCIISEEQILQLSAQELRASVSTCPLLILGGIGFSGLNTEYNAVNLSYGVSFDTLPREEARKKDIEASEMFNGIYKKLSTILSDKRVIVLSHMRKDDWNYLPGWIYVNGHNHRNYSEVSEQRKIYANNQIGYKTQSVGLKYFYTDNDYDIFSDYPNGYHTINASPYIEFNCAKRISSTFNRPAAEIIMLKQDGVYMFLYYGKYNSSAESKKLYLLDGGRMRRLKRRWKADVNIDIADYFHNLKRYVQNAHSLLDKYTGEQNRISQFVKNIGGSGKVHGCIVDVDLPNDVGGYSYYHLFVNPFDGTVTPYFAWDVKSRIIYRDFKTMLENAEQLKMMLSNYKELEAAHSSILPAIRYSNNITEWGEDDCVYNEGGYLYPISRFVKSLQYCTEKNIVRIWNENLLDHDFVKQAIISNTVDDVLIKKLIPDAESME